MKKKEVKFEKVSKKYKKNPIEEEEVENEKVEEGFDFMGLLNNPDIAASMGSIKDLFKKEKQNPDICEITIKAPSAVVLKLFGLDK